MIHKNKNRLLLLLLSLLLTVGAGEIILQLSDFSNELKAGKNNYDEKFIYNSWGHRDYYEHTLKKPRDKFRILVLGDSMTVGSGIKNVKNTYPKKLETYLNEKLQQPQFEIINTAGKGWNTDTELYDLLLNGLKFQPDMIFLAYYHNDIPRPNFLSCDSSEIDLISGNGPLKDLLKKFRLYGFVNFRANRLLEKMGKKPRFTDCINASYSSLGWEMEKVYLDAINMACSILNIKLVIGIIPLIYKLDDDYPIALVHSKIKRYCKERNIECIDFYDDGFKGLNANSLVVSKNDRHLNVDGAEVVAQSLYKMLEPLGQYKRLPVTHRAFTIQELLAGDDTAKEVDRLFDQIKEGDSGLVFPSFLPNTHKKQSELIIWKKLGNYFFLKTIFDFNGRKKFESKYTLNKTGKFLNYTLNTFDPILGSIVGSDLLESKDNRFVLTKILPQLGEKKREEKIIYRFHGLKKLQGGYSLRMEEGVHFYDPKTIVRLALDNRSNLRSEKREILFYNVLIFYYRYNWNYFADALIKEVLDRNPLPVYLNAIDRLYRNTNQLAKLEKLANIYPELTQRTSE